MTKNICLVFLKLFLSFSAVHAQLNAEDAQKLKKEAKENEEMAKIARREAERYRYLMAADEIANRSTEVNDKELAGLLALQAYNFSFKQKGYSRRSTIHNALLSALKRYGYLPRNMDEANKSTIDDKKKKMTIADAKNEHLRWILSLQPSPIEQIKFSPSGKLLATLSRDNSIRIWNLEIMSQQPLTFLEKDSIVNFGFTSDNSQILCELINPEKRTNVKNFIHVYPLDISIMANELCKLLTRNLTKDEWDYFIGDSNYQQTCPDLPRK